MRGVKLCQHSAELCEVSVMGIYRQHEWKGGMSNHLQVIDVIPPPPSPYSKRRWNAEALDNTSSRQHYSLSPGAE